MYSITGKSINLRQEVQWSSKKCRLFSLVFWLIDSHESKIGWAIELDNWKCNESIALKWVSEQLIHMDGNEGIRDSDGFWGTVTNSAPVGRSRKFLALGAPRAKKPKGQNSFPTESNSVIVSERSNADGILYHKKFCPWNFKKSISQLIIQGLQNVIFPV